MCQATLRDGNGTADTGMHWLHGGAHGPTDAVLVAGKDLDQAAVVCWADIQILCKGVVCGV